MSRTDGALHIDAAATAGEGAVTELDRQECMRLLATHCIGRIVYTHQALPAITPVNYILAGHRIYVRTTATSSIARAAQQEAVVAFEVDEIDRELEAGWSVVIVGSLRLVADPSEVLRAAQLALRPWAGGRRETIVSITPGVVSGRVVGLAGGSIAGLAG